MFISAFTIWLLLFQLQADSLDKYREGAKKWDDDVAELVAKNAEKTAGPNDLLLIGSSSIRLWDSIDSDMPDWSAVRRGYGGAKYSDLVIQLDKLLAGHHPKAILFYVANDIAGGNDNKDIAPQEVGTLVEYVARHTRELNPTTPIFFIQLSATPKRWHVWEKTTEANGEIEKVAKSVDNCYYIQTADLFIDRISGEPNPKFFRDDKLHLSAEGYKLWAGRIQEQLDKQLKKE
jgi:lysophospholipase L1-like esterase